MLKVVSNWKSIIFFSQLFTDLELSDIGIPDLCLYMDVCIITMTFFVIFYPQVEMESSVI